MTGDSPKLPRTPGVGPDAERREAERRERQAAALRENLRKRKAATRAKREPGRGDGGEVEGGADAS